MHEEKIIFMWSYCLHNLKCSENHAWKALYVSVSLLTSDEEGVSEEGARTVGGYIPPSDPNTLK